MTKKNHYGLIVLMLFLLKCTSIPKPPASTAATTFTIEEPKEFACYLRHQQSGAPTTKISVVINLKTYFYDGQRSVPLDDNKNLQVDPNNTPFPVTLTANMPSDGTFGKVEVTIQGLNCSECASGYGNTMESTGPCYSSGIPNSSPPQYRAAIPQWYDSFVIRAYSTTVNLGHMSRVPNVSNSCGCTVQ